MDVVTGMRIVVAFHDLPAVARPIPGEAFWLADTSANRAVAEETWATGTTDSNSALFDWDADVVEDADVLERFADVDLHHPGWTEIVFPALSLSTDLEAHFKEHGVRVDRSSDGFRVSR